MSTKRQASQDLTTFHIRLPKAVKARLTDEAKKQGVSAAMVITDLIDNYLGKPKASVAPAPFDDEQTDLEQWLDQHAR